MVSVLFFFYLFFCFFFLSTFYVSVDILMLGFFVFAEPLLFSLVSVGFYKGSHGGSWDYVDK